MEQALDFNKPEGKVYKTKWVASMAFICGPIGAGYLIAQNFKTFGRPDRARITWILAIFLTLGLIWLAYTLPEDMPFGRIIFPAITTAIAYFFMDRLQSERISVHIENGGEVYGIGNRILVGLATLAIYLIPIGYLFYQDQQMMDGYSTKTYGRNSDQNLVYQTNEFSNTELDKVADGLFEFGYFTNFDPSYIYLDAEGEIYKLILVTEEQFLSDPGLDDAFREMQEYMDEYIVNHPVEVHVVTDDINETRRKFE
ncbi:MAG: hypothetical protein HWE14_07150 [Flavobacteriia bacterium]|nr:hypothetical protein [Flavobacteriia bacterium]